MIFLLFLSHLVFQLLLQFIETLLQLILFVVLLSSLFFYLHLCFTHNLTIDDLAVIMTYVFHRFYLPQKACIHS